MTDETAQRIAEYDDRMARWADRLAGAELTDDQAQGFACVACGHNQITDRDARTFVVVAYGTAGISSHLFACESCDQAGVSQ